jgi:predicted Zn-dependent protease
MKKYLVLLVLFTSCATNSYTGKRTLNFYGNNKVFPMAAQQYDKFLSESEPSKGVDANRIKIIGSRIAHAAQKYYNHIGKPNALKDYQWEYNLVKDKTVNAWCMPGGKIVFYTGILPIAKNNDGIAAIMGHEVAHALADHGAQRMSAGTLQEAGGILITLGTNNKDEATKNSILQAYGMTSNVAGMLPFSRKHESEADKIGLELMAIAGYDTKEAAKLWQRMSENSKGKAPAEILSTHPSNERRIRDLGLHSSKADSLAKVIGIIR